MDHKVKLTPPNIDRLSRDKADFEIRHARGELVPDTIYEIPDTKERYYYTFGKTLLRLDDHLVGNINYDNRTMYDTKEELDFFYSKGLLKDFVVYYVAQTKKMYIIKDGLLTEIFFHKDNYGCLEDFITVLRYRPNDIEINKVYLINLKKYMFDGEKIQQLKTVKTIELKEE